MRLFYRAVNGHPTNAEVRSRIPKPVGQQTGPLYPSSAEGWLTAHHSGLFSVEVIDRRSDELTRQYAGRGSDAHHPTVLLVLLIYGYARHPVELEDQAYDLRFCGVSLCRCQHAFQPRYADQLPAPLRHAVRTTVRPGADTGREMGMLKLGKISVDGSQIEAKASLHSALPWAHLNKIDTERQHEIKDLMALAKSDARKKYQIGWVCQTRSRAG
jgi:hypothetical protein